MTKQTADQLAELADQQHQPIAVRFDALKAKVHTLTEAVGELDTTVQQQAATIEFLLNVNMQILKTFDEPSMQGRRRAVDGLDKKLKLVREQFLYGDPNAPFPMGMNPEPIADVLIQTHVPPPNPNQDAINQAAEAGRREALGLPPQTAPQAAQPGYVYGTADEPTFAMAGNVPMEGETPLAGSDFLISDDPDATL